MAVIRLVGFTGCNPAIHPLMLPDTVGTSSVNQSVWPGELRPLKAPLSVRAAPSGRRGLYRMGQTVGGRADYWLTIRGQAEFARSLVAEDTSERVFYTSSEAPPRWTNNIIGLGDKTGTEYPALSRNLGVPAPTTAPTLQTNRPKGAGDTGAQSLYYVYTYVNELGEESAPSPVSPLLVTAQPGLDGCIVSVDFQNEGPLQDVNRRRIYRTQAGQAVAGGFYFVAEVPWGTMNSATIVEGNNSYAFPPITARFNAFDQVLDVQEPLPSLAWLPPPANLRGLKPLWNGMLAGFVGKSVRVCEPFRPFAWPLQYELVVEDDITGLAVLEQQLLVLTRGRTYAVAGSSPEALSLAPIGISQSCVSIQSVVEFGDAVMWATPEGLAVVGTGGSGLLTEPRSGGAFTKEAWKVMNPATMVAGRFENFYVCSYVDASNVRKSFMLDRRNPGQVHFNDQGFVAAHFDPLLNELFVLDESSPSFPRIVSWGAGLDPMEASFESKEWRTTGRENFAWARVTANNFPLEFRLIADGVVRFDKIVVDDNPFRLPGGFRAERWRVRVKTSHAVQAVMLTSSLEEMQRV